MTTTIQIIDNPKGNPPGKLAEAELHFSGGILDGLKFIGFAIWERRTGSGRNVTFPARQYAVNGERRSFALLRPASFDPGSITSGSQDRIRDLILDAYRRTEEHPTLAHWTYDDAGHCLTAPKNEPAEAEHIADHPRIRAAVTCPLCHNEKETGLIACWTCYRSHDMRNGLSTSAAAILTHAEREATNLAGIASSLFD
jgi:hypothetical protein